MRERGERGDDFQHRKSTVFVDNLPNGIRKGFMYNLFSRFGKITDCFIPIKKSRVTGQSFGFVRYESARDASQAVVSTNGTWIWGQELLVNIAKFLKKQDRYPTQIYNRGNYENQEDGDVNFRNQWRYENQPSKFRPHVNKGNSSGKGKELVPFQEKPWIQMYNPFLKNLGERGQEVWRRKRQPESSEQGEDKRVTTQKGKTINVQAEGNGWLDRSAVGKIRRLISAKELESLFKKEKVGNVQIKPMGGRYVIITFSSEERKNEILKEKWLELWFEEVNPWNGESAKNERFVWVACYGMPLNAWNVPSFRAIGSIWGCFIEVHNDTLREVSFAKGKFLIATENPSKIDGEVELIVNGRKYNVKVEEEDTFRTVSSTYQVSNSEAEKEDDEVDNSEDDRDASKKKGKNLMDDMEQQRNKYPDDIEKNKEEEAEKGENSVINGSHHSGLEKETLNERPPIQEKTFGVMIETNEHPLTLSKSALGNLDTGERINEESTNSTHGLDSIVQDSQSPLIEDCSDSVNNNSKVQNTEAQEGNKQKQEKERVTKVTNNPVVCDSNIIITASQVQGINLHVDLNQNAVRRSIRSQQLEASLSTEGDDLDGYIIASQEQEQNAMDEELQNTLIAGKTLGIKFGDSGILRMKKMIENEAKEMKASLKNNTFAALMRDY